MHLASIVVLLIFLVGLSLYISMIQPLQNLDGPRKTSTSFFNVNTLNGCKQAINIHLPKGEPLGSHMVMWKHPVHINTPTVFGWTMNKRVH